MKLISKVIIIVGLCLIGYSSFYMWNGKEKQKKSLQRAEQNLTMNSGTKAHLYTPKAGDEIGILEFPTLNESLPIIEGADEEELARGVGHYTGSALPSQQGQIVLSGHRDTVFRRLGELEIGDQLAVQMPYGQHIYKIEKTEIVSADDLTVITPDLDEERLTVTTCYPFSFIGDAPDRYIIHAKPLRQLR